MDNSKRNVHNSGPLGMLMQKGQIKKIDDSGSDTLIVPEPKQKNSQYFKTQSGIEFAENELMHVNSAECESWEYANRQENEMGDIDELIESIRANGQLQPALIRTHPSPHGSFKYEVIFGRRRHIACLKLGIPFLVIRKEISSIQEAIAFQDAENKFRNDVSNYSNAKLYERLLNDSVFPSKKALAEKLRISTTGLNDLMVFTKIPQDIISLLPDVHSLSKNLALKIASLLNENKANHEKLIQLAPQIGITINSPTRLEKMAEDNGEKKSLKKSIKMSKQYKSKDGQKLFTFKYDQRGAPSIIFDKKAMTNVDFEKICLSLQNIVEDEHGEFRYRNSDIGIQ